MHDGSDNAHKGLAWPEAYEGLLPILQKQWGISQEIYLSRKLSGGKSGALVYAADISSEVFTGQAILKLDQASDSKSQEAHEAALHEQAIEDAPEFAAKHLPRLLHSLHHGQQMAILSTIAGRGLEYAEPWTACAYDRKLTVVRQMSVGILEEWNADFHLKDGMHAPQELLASWLGRRLKPSIGGRIHSFLSDDCGIAANVPTVMFEGHWYPNPLAFADGVVPLPERLQLRGAVGHCHGDFHGLNLLVARSDGPNQGPNYHLIDLAMYESAQYLFYDHAYFEIAFLLAARADKSSKDWEAIVAQLSCFQHHDEQPGLQAEDIGLVEIATVMRQSMTDWIERHEADRLSFMESQVLLARIATGLNFSHKSIPLKIRQMAFFYAAANLKDYLRLNQVDWPKSGPTFVIDGQVPAATEAGADRDTHPPDATPQPAPAPEPATAVDEPAPAMAATAASLAAHQPENRHDLIGRFFYELRRRQVMRVAGLYLVVAWLCLQVVSAFQNTLLLPTWTDTLVAVLLAVGFPIVCVIAWAFELSAQGLQPTRQDTETPPKTLTSGAVVDYSVLVGIVVILGLMAYAYLPGQSGGTVRDSTGGQQITADDGSATGPPAANPATTVDGSATATSDAPGAGAQEPAAEDNGLTTLAVIPFRNLSGSDANGFVAGLTIALINILEESDAFTMPGLTSVFQYRETNADLKEIGAQLGVDYLVEGAVRKADEDILIEAKLVNASNGFTMWSGTFADTQSDVFQAQERIARAIGDALSTPLNLNADSLKAAQTANPEAYKLYLEGLAAFQKRGEAMVEAMTVLRQAVDMAPDFAAAWAALSLVYNYLPIYLTEVDGRPVVPSIYYRRAQEAALNARNLAPELPVVQHALGNMYQRNRQWREAENAYEASLVADADNPSVMVDYATLLQTVGKQAQALNLIVQAQSLDPASPLYRMIYATLRWQAHQTEANVEVLEGMFLADPPFREFTLRTIIGHRARVGELDKAAALVEACDQCPEELRTRALTIIDTAKLGATDTLLTTYRDDPLLSYDLLAAVGGPDAVLDAFAYLGPAAERRAQFFTVPWSVINVVGPRNEFVEIADDMGLLNYWRLRGSPDHCEPRVDGTFDCG